MISVKHMVRAIKLESAVRSAGCPVRDEDMEAHQRRRLQDDRKRFDEEQSHDPWEGEQ